MIRLLLFVVADAGAGVPAVRERGFCGRRARLGCTKEGEHENLESVRVVLCSPAFSHGAIVACLGALRAIYLCAEKPGSLASLFFFFFLLIFMFLRTVRVLLNDA